MVKILAIAGPSERSGFRLDELARVRLLAIRRRVFFRVLNRVERGLVYLVSKVTKSVRSRVLVDALRSIVEKLLDAMESKVGQTDETCRGPARREDK